MGVTLRRFDASKDIGGISRFLSESYEPMNRDGNWIQPMWDYSCFHSLTDMEALAEVGVWEDGNEIVAATIFDLHKVDISLCTGAQYKHLKSDMAKYAEDNLSVQKEGIRKLNIYVHDFDADLADTLGQAGYLRRPESDRTLSFFRIPSPFPDISLPEGFVLKSLSEHNDLRKIHRVCHRGFNHPGEPPEDELDDRKIMQSSPNFRPDLTIVVIAPSGDYATYCGMWYDQRNKYCYVEPVATDPDYRRRGLGTATVMESIRRSALLGADVSYVWSDKAFYGSMGFQKLNSHHCWSKNL